MAKDLIAFDYASVDKDTKGKLIALAGQFRTTLKDHTQSGMSLGEIVADAHELLAGDGRDGSFKQWVESELGVSRKTAYNYLWAWQKFGKCRTVIHFFDSGALYALASPQAPDRAANEALKLADKGHKITLDKAKALLKRYREVVKANGSKSSNRHDVPIDHNSGDEESKHRQNLTPTPSDTQAAVADGPLNDEPEDDLDFADMVKRDNSRIESFCRQLVKFFEDNCPKLQSVDHMGRYDSALAHVRSACGTLRTCKYHDSPCPKCSGAGCSSCRQESDFGAVTVLTYRQLAG